jgi:hypothetical protein
MSLLLDHNEVCGSKYKAMEYALFSVYIKQDVFTLVTQLDIDFVTVSSHGFLFAFGICRFKNI